MGERNGVNGEREGRKDEFHYTQEGPRAIPKDLVLWYLGPEHYQTIFRMFRVF